MFRSSVLAASLSSCALWRCPHFLRRWRLPPALMAYGEREGGVFHGAFSVGRCAGLAALCVYFVLVVHPWSFYPRAFAAAGSGSCSLAIHCLRLFARVGIPLLLLLFLRPPVCGLRVWWRWCALRWRGAPFARFCGVALHTITSLRLGCPLGIPSYHPCSVPRCWQPLVLRVFFGGVHIFFCVGGLESVRVRERRKGWFSWLFYGSWAHLRRVSHVSPLAAALVVYFHTHLLALAAAYICAGIPLALLVPLGMWYMCFVVVVRSPVACGSLLSVTCGCPSYHASFLRADSLEYRGHRTHTLVVGRRWGACGGRLFGGGYVSLFIPCCACGGSRGVRAWAYLMAASCPRALLHVFHVVVYLFLFFRVALCVWGVSSP